MICSPLSDPPRQLFCLYFWEPEESGRASKISYPVFRVCVMMDKMFWKEVLCQTDADL
jgi:hypothetical protein